MPWVAAVQVQVEVLAQEVDVLALEGVLEKVEEQVGRVVDASSPEGVLGSVVGAVGREEVDV